MISITRSAYVAACDAVRDAYLNAEQANEAVNYKHAGYVVAKPTAEAANLAFEVAIFAKSTARDAYFADLASVTE